MGEVAKAALATTAAVVNAVAKHAAVEAKHAMVKVEAKAVMTAPMKQRPTRPAATAPKVDADVDAASAQTDAVAKRLGPQKRPPTPWQAIWKSASARQPSALRVKKPTDAVAVDVVVSATTRVHLTRKCHWQKMRLPTMKPVMISKLCPMVRQRQAKAASASMSAVNDATVTVMAAIVRPAQKSPMTQTQTVWITLGHPQHPRLLQWQHPPWRQRRTKCPASPPMNCPWGSCSKSPLVAVWSG